MDDKNTTLEIAPEHLPKLTAIAAIVGLSKRQITNNMIKYCYSRPEAFGATTPSTKSQVKKLLDSWE